jgi:pyruvate/2-oxoglutarate dehydrogenase complex dihydrolipoamide acyltransferase (E2) component
MIEIILPAMGEGIIEAEVTRWLVREGEPIEQDQPVVEVATDKVDSELPSPGSGTIHKIMIKEGDTAKVGQVMALISTSDEKDIEDEPLENRQTEILAEKRPAATRDLPVEAIPAPQDMLFKDIAFLSPAIR